ncbi:MAG: hypothetical protein MUE97_06250, partial [Phycisphaerales bacterium]|nr:hypothetical protein [Phycisphaerales bacterium]
GLVAAAGLASPGLAGGIDLCDVKQMGMPDFDQRRSGLTGNGGVHCVPTSMSNILGYFAIHGIPQAFPGVNTLWGQEDYSQITINILTLGVFMDTSLPDGTNGNDGFDGMKTWIDTRAPGKIGLIRISGGGVNPAFISIYRNILGGYIAPCYGRYRDDDNNNVWDRDGGHCVTLHRLRFACSNVPEMSVRDPATDEGNVTNRLTQQSPFTVRTFNISKWTGNLSGTTRTRWRIEPAASDVYALFDSMYVLVPLVQLTASGQNVVIAPAVPLVNQDPPSPVNTGSAVLNHQLASDLASVTVVHGNAGGTPTTIRQVSLLDGSRRVLGSTTSKQIAHGRRGQVYFIDGNQLVCVDSTPLPPLPPIELARVTLPGVPEGLAVDPVTDQVCVAIAAGVAGPRLARFSKTLSPIATNFYPAIGGTGELKIKPGPQSGQWRLGRVGGPSVRTILPPGTPTGSFTNGAMIDLPGTDTLQDFNFHSGELVYSTPVVGTPNFVTRAAKQDVNGRWVSHPDHPFFNRPGGGVMSFMTHMDMFDPALDGPIDQSIGPAVDLIALTGPSVPDCVADVAGANQWPEPDGELTADDIIVFLARYFRGDGRADVAGANQAPTPDGQFSADDIIVFLNRYFIGC